MEKTCPYCQGTGFEQVKGKNSTPSGVKRCRCRLERKIKGLLENSRIPERFSHCRMDNFKVYFEHRGKEVINPSLSVAFEYCRKFIEKYPDVQQGFFFVGPQGVGKTHLAVAVIRELIEKKGVEALFYDLRDLLFELGSSFDENSKVSNQEVLRPVLGAELLLLDDLGTSKVTAWRRDMLEYLISSRYNNRKLTFFTSSCLDKPSRPEEKKIEEMIGPRIRSRISEMCTICHLDAKDFRKQKTNIANLSSIHKSSSPSW